MSIERACMKAGKAAGLQTFLNGLLKQAVDRGHIHQSKFCLPSAPSLPVCFKPAIANTLRKLWEIQCFKLPHMEKAFICGINLHPHAAGAPVSAHPPKLVAIGGSGCHTHLHLVMRATLCFQAPLHLLCAELHSMRSDLSCLPFKASDRPCGMFVRTH